MRGTAGPRLRRDDVTTTGESARKVVHMGGGEEDRGFVALLSKGGETEQHLSRSGLSVVATYTIMFVCAIFHRSCLFRTMVIFYTCFVVAQVSLSVLCFGRYGGYCARSQLLIAFLTKTE